MPTTIECGKPDGGQQTISLRRPEDEPSQGRLDYFEQAVAQHELNDARRAHVQGRAERIEALLETAVELLGRLVAQGLRAPPVKAAATKKTTVKARGRK